MRTSCFTMQLKLSNRQSPSLAPWIHPRSPPAAPASRIGNPHQRSSRVKRGFELPAFVRMLRPA